MSKVILPHSPRIAVLWFSSSASNDLWEISTLLQLVKTTPITPKWVSQCLPVLIRERREKIRRNIWFDCNSFSKVIVIHFQKLKKLNEERDVQKSKSFRTQSSATKICSQYTSITPCDFFRLCVQTSHKFWDLFILQVHVCLCNNVHKERFVTWMRVLAHAFEDHSN